MREKKFKVTIEKDTDGTYVAYTANSDKYFITGRGDTITEAKEDFYAVLNDTIDYERECENGVSEILLAEPVFRFDLRSLFEYLPMLNVSTFANFVGINPALMRYYKKKDAYISGAQLAKIEDGLHKLGEMLSAIKLS